MAAEAYYRHKTFVNDAIKIHGDRYDYSNVNYINQNTKVTITCPIHGDFEQSPKSHKRGSGCQKCGKILQQEKWNSQKSSIIKKIKSTNMRLYGNESYSSYTMGDSVKLLLDRDWLYNQHHIENKTAKTISRELLVDKSTVCNYLSLHNIPIKYQFVSDAEICLRDFISGFISKDKMIFNDRTLIGSELDRK